MRQLKEPECLNQLQKCNSNVRLIDRTLSWPWKQIKLIFFIMCLFNSSLKINIFKEGIFTKVLWWPKWPLCQLDTTTTLSRPFTKFNNSNKFMAETCANVTFLSSNILYCEDGNIQKHLGTYAHRYKYNPVHMRNYGRMHINECKANFM